MNKILIFNQKNLNMDKEFSEHMKEVLSYSREEAIRLGNSMIDTDHLFLGLLREGTSQALRILEMLHCNIEFSKQQIDLSLREPMP